MRQIIRPILEFVRCTRGTVMIETALVAPVLVLLALGSFEVSRIVARQVELQSGALEGQQIALAANMGAATDVSEVKTLLKNSLGLGDSGVTVEKLFRCDDASALVSASSSCGSGAVVSSYIRITLKDSYEPIWTHLGIGQGFDYNIVRMVQLS